MSFGGRLAQVRAIQAWTSERRAWSSAEELNRGEFALAGPEHKRGGSGAKRFPVRQFGRRSSVRPFCIAFDFRVSFENIGDSWHAMNGLP
jgi:hypothetical protein